MSELPFALEILEKINKKIATDPMLRSIFIEREYDFLQLYQPLIFLDLRTYRTNKKKGDNARTASVAKILLVQLLIFTVSLVSFLWLMVSRKKVLIFSTDKADSSWGGDFRLQGIYKFLRQKGIPFGEIFYTGGGAVFSKNLFVRKRTAFYLQAPEMLYSFLLKIGIKRNPDTAKIEKADFSDFGEHSEEVRGILIRLAKRIPRSIFLIKTLRNILRLSGVKILFTIDSVRRYGELIAACKMSGITTYAFQHGQFSKYQVGWRAASDNRRNIIKPDILFVWSEYWKKELLSLGTYFTKEDLILSQNAKGGHLPKVIPAEEDGFIGVLVPFERTVPKKDIVPTIERIKDCPKVKIFFKTRPDLSKEEQLEAYSLTAGSVTAVRDEKGIMNKIDVIVGAQSTFLYELIYYERPVLIMPSSLDILEGMIKNGLADMMGDNVCKSISEAAVTMKGALIERKKMLFGTKINSVEEVVEDALKKSGVIR